MPGPLPSLSPSNSRGSGRAHTSAPLYGPVCEVQRERILLLAHQHPLWRNAEIVAGR